MSKSCEGCLGTGNDESNKLDGSCTNCAGAGSFCEDCKLPSTMCECDYREDIEDYDESYNYYDPYSDDYLEFSDPGGNSALRAGPRIHPCPTCHASNALSEKDVQLGYQCDGCANAAERGIDRDYVCGGAKGGCQLCIENQEENTDVAD